MDLKICTKCNSEKPLSEYYSWFCKTRNKRRTNSCCKVCKDLQVAESHSKNPEGIKRWDRARYDKNRDRYREKGARYRACKLERTPAWVDIKKLQEIYKECPPGYHVDHIVPLQGEGVCGLHVPWNLQYLPAKENLSKGNRWR